MRTLIRPYSIHTLFTSYYVHIDRSPLIRELSTSITNHIALYISPYAIRIIYTTLLTTLTTSEDWRIKVNILVFFKNIAIRCSKQISTLLPILIPIISECILDPKRQVQLQVCLYIYFLCSTVYI